MRQVKQYAVIPSQVKPNQIQGLPPDLQTSAEVASPTGDNPLSTGADGDEGGSVPLGDGEVGLPTPAIIQVKSQTVNILEDGTATIDVVLEVEDVPGVFEYDIRVAKDAGTV